MKAVTNEQMNLLAHYFELNNGTKTSDYRTNTETMQFDKKKKDLSDFILIYSFSNFAIVTLSEKYIKITYKI